MSPVELYPPPNNVFRLRESPVRCESPSTSCVGSNVINIRLQISQSQIGGMSCLSYFN